MPGCSALRHGVEEFVRTSVHGLETCATYQGFKVAVECRSGGFEELEPTMSTMILTTMCLFPSATCSTDDLVGWIPRVLWGYNYDY